MRFPNCSAAAKRKERLNSVVVYRPILAGQGSSRDKTTAKGRVTVDTFTIYAEDGEYVEEARSIEEALAQFRQLHPNLFVSAVVNDGMRPGLVIDAG